MKTEAQNIAIAEACGWERNSKQCAFNPQPHMWFNKNDGCCYNECPSYTTNLNAMHEAENIVICPEGCECVSGKDLSSIYADWLRKIHERDRGKIRTIDHTAAQRAEAFLRTILKWRDDI